MTLGASSPVVFETERLAFREMNQDDFLDLAEMLQNPKVMYAYEHAFSEAEVDQWLERQLERYRTWEFGLWAVVEKDSGEMVGQCGITMQECGNERVPEIGWLLRRDCWHQGHASEAAMACRAYAFERLGFNEVFSIIRDTNTASQRVAQRIGMEPRFTLVKHYYGIDMPHIVFSIRK